MKLPILLFTIAIYCAITADCQSIVDSCFSFDGEGESHDFDNGEIHKSKNIVCSWQDIIYWKNDTLASPVKMSAGYYQKLKFNLERLFCKNDGKTLAVLEFGENFYPEYPRNSDYYYFYSPKLTGKGLYNTFIALKLTKPLGESNGIVKIPFMYSALTDFSTFTPSIYTNVQPELLNADYVSDLKSTPPTGDSVVWTRDTIAINVKKSQYKHQWLIIYAHYMTHEKDIGLFLSPCADCIEIPLRKSKTDCIDSVNRLFTHGKMVIPNVSFDNNQYDLKSSAIPRLDSLINFLLSKPTFKIQIVGYTDSIGNENANSILSLNRSHSVYLYLLKGGIKEERMSCIGMGDKNPLCPNTTEENRARNRRVEIELIKK